MSEEGDCPFAKTSVTGVHTFIYNGNEGLSNKFDSVLFSRSRGLI
jgi:hypothetical protein